MVKTLNYYYISQFMIDPKIIKAVAEEINLPERVVEKTYNSFWRFIRDKAESLPLKEDLTEEEFNNLQVNFNIPSIGKLICPWDRYNSIKTRYNNFIKVQNGTKHNKD